MEKYARQFDDRFDFDETFENSDEKQALSQTEYEAENISEQKSDTNNNEDLSPVTGVKWERLLEKKLDEDFDRKLIHTVRGVGYVLRADEEVKP